MDHRGTDGPRAKGRLFALLDHLSPLGATFSPRDGRTPAFETRLENATFGRRICVDYIQARQGPEGMLRQVFELGRGLAEITNLEDRLPVENTILKEEVTQALRSTERVGESEAHQGR